MPDEDARLTDFVPDEPGDAAARDDAPASERDDAPEADVDPDDARATEPEEAAVGPATPTATWTPGGEPCDACGAVAERRWRDAGALRCRDCKEW